MKERDQALLIANNWLEFKMSSLVQMVPGDPDCDACILARQYVRALDEIGELRGQLSAAGCTLVTGSIMAKRLG